MFTGGIKVDAGRVGNSVKSGFVRGDGVTHPSKLVPTLFGWNTTG